VFLDVPEHVAIQRLSSRIVCGACSAVYNLETKAPQIVNVCDICKSSLSQRVDDQPVIIRTRLEVYRRQTEAIVAYYSSCELMRRVDGTRPPDVSVAEVLSHVRSALTSGVGRGQAVDP
jgi:adenylate kinase